MKKIISIFIIFASNFSYSQIIESKPELWLNNQFISFDSLGNFLKWTDRSGNHHDAIPTAEQLPFIHQNAVNKFSVIGFNGKNNGLCTKDSLENFKSKRGTLIVVCKINGKSYRSSPGIGNIVSTYHGKGCRWQFCGGPEGYSFYDGKSSHVLKQIPMTQNFWALHVLQRTSDSTIDYFYNGRKEKTLIINSEQPDFNSIKIGYNGLPYFKEEDVSEVFNGEIGEIILFNNDLKPEILDEIQKVLLAKFAIEKSPLPWYLQTWFLLTCSGFFTVALWALVKSIQIRKIKKQLEIIRLQQQLNEERIRISKDIHDELGTGISKIALLSVLPEGADGKKRFEKIHSVSLELTESMKDLVWTLNTENNKISLLFARIREYAGEISEDLNLTVRFNFPDLENEILISGTRQRNIYLAFKEALSNALKYSECTEITIEAKIINKVLTCSFRDNGKGFNPSSNHSGGNGLKNMKSRMEQIGGKIEIVSKEGHGTEVLFHVPL